MDESFTNTKLSLILESSQRPWQTTFDCWNCPVAKRGMAAIEPAFTRKIKFTHTLLHYVKKYSEMLGPRDKIKIIDF